MTALALLAAGLAGWWSALPPGLARLSAPAEPAVRRRWRPAWLVPIGVGVLAGWLGGWAVGLGLTSLVATAGWVLAAGRRRAAARARRGEVVRSCQLLGGFVRLGLVPSAALRAACVEAPLLAEAAAQQAMGGPVVPALRAAAGAPGGSGLAELAAAWEVAEVTGASLATTLDAVADRLAADAELRATVEAELAAPRATGRLLAVLPLAGLALGYLMGGDPLAFLTGSWFGQACLVSGVMLGCGGLVWTELLADRHGG